MATDGLLKLRPAPAASPNARFFTEFRRKAREQRVPVSGMLELTSRCNLRCVHCYLGPQEEAHAKRDQEMDTAQVKRTPRGYRVLEVMAIDTGQYPERARALKIAWLETALQRLYQQEAA